MADSDDWRAERAAQLAGTPFARPSTAPRLDDTLPIQTRSASPLARPVKAAATSKPAKPAVSPSAISGPRSNRRTLTIAGLLAVAAAAVGVVEWRQGTGGDANSLPVSSIRVPEQAHLAPVAVVPAPIITPEPSPVSPSPAVGAAPDPTADRLSSQPPVVKPHKTGRSVKVVNVSPSTHVVRKGRPPQHARANPHSDTASSTPVPTVGMSTTSPADAAIKLPVCQPNVYSRPSRPCRPSRSRQVREPFYDN